MSPSAHIRTCAELAQGCSAASWVLMVCVALDYIVGRFPENCQQEKLAFGFYAGAFRQIVPQMPFRQKVREKRRHARAYGADRGDQFT